MSADHARRDTQLGIRVTAETHAFYSMVAADVEGLSLSVWIRQALDKAAFEAIRQNSNKLKVE